MATGKSAFNFYNQQKYGTVPENIQKDMDVPPDMHLKMSKKIAQLTKVIYALNTKNDEHENAVRLLKERHEQQILQILAETKTKVEDFQSKVQTQLQYQKQIETLQNALEDREKRERNLLYEFETYKKSVQDQRSKSKSDHIQKIVELTQEVRNAKTSFEEQLKLLQSEQNRQSSDKQGVIEQFAQKHASELDDYRRKLDSQSDEFTKVKEKIAFEHSNVVERLKGDCDRITESKKQLIADYEGKLAKSQGFYENELDVLRNSQTANADDHIRSLNDENAKMRKDFAYQETQLRKRLDDVIGQLSALEEETGSHSALGAELRAQLAKKDEEYNLINTQLLESQREVERLIRELRNAEEELSTSKKISADQASDLMTKSTKIGELEALRSQHESRIDHMNAEIARLKDRIGQLEKSRKQLESRSLNEMSEQSQHAEHLQRALEDERMARETLQQKLENEIESLHKENQSRQKQLTDEYQGKFDKLLSDHRVELESLRNKLHDEKNALGKTWETRLHDEKEKSTSDNSEIGSLMEKVKAELEAKLNVAQNEIARLEGLIAESEAGLGCASSHITTLKAEAERLRVDLHTARSNLAASQDTNKQQQETIEKAEQSYKIAVKEAEERLKTELEILTEQLNTQWKERLKQECDSLRRQLSAQTDADKQSALDRLTQMREDELQAAKSGWEGQINELTLQITSLKLDHSEQETRYLNEIEALKSQNEADGRKLREDMYASAEEYARKLACLEEVHREEMRKLISQKQREIEETEKRMLDRHIESTRAAQLAHESSQNALRDKADADKDMSLSDLADAHRRELESLKTELGHKHSQEIEQYSRAHGAQMSAARLELDRAIELAKQKETKYEIELSEMQDDLRRKALSIENLEMDIQTLHTAVDELGREVESKGKEVLQTRSDANRDLKRKEDELNRGHKKQLDALTADHLRETENILEQFNRAQELLKDKISQMQIALHEAETRFEDRESRPEDLEMISQLKESLNDREENLKRINDEKRYFQLELVNRETNFNKVFNAAPNVGIMNPLTVKKRKSSVDKGKNGGSASSPSLNSLGKLQPLPGSPLHDERLNPVRPLPPPQLPQKQFVK